MARSQNARSAGFFVLRSPLLPFETFAELRAAPWPRLRELFAHDPLVREAILIASPELHDAFAADAAPSAAMQRALLRYVSRMAARATPFGLMAAVSRGEIAASTSLDVHRRDLRKHVRLDHGYVTRTRERGPRLTPNETIYELGGALRYIERTVADDAYTYSLTALDGDEPLRATLFRARDGATLDELADALVEDDPEISPADARAYVAELVRQDVLRDDGEPFITGTAGASLGGRTLESGAPVQIDAAFDSPVTLSRRHVDQLRAAAGVLHQLFGRTRDAELDAFRERFRARFDRREVPLLVALDPDAGVALGAGEPAAAPLIDGLATPEHVAAETHVRSAVDDLLLRKLHEALSAGTQEVEVTRAEIDALAPPRPLPLPATFAIFGSILSDSTTQIESVTGASGARLLGRFCAVLPPLERDLREYLEAERHDHCVIAEVVHVPEGRLGNVVVRPSFYDYEIPLAGRSGAPRERQLPLDDLRLSVVGDELVLRSARLDARVIPRVTNAHNYEARTNLPIYRLLAKMQGHGEAASVSWSWSMLAGAPFLPRVRFRRCVLSRARWTLAASELEDVARVRRERGLPRFVEHDRLALDLDNALCVEELRRIARRGSAVALREVLLPSMRRMNEVIVPLINPEPRERVRPRPAAGTVRRTFPPGSEWTYVKIYSGPSAADALLTGIIAPLARAHAARWFFARYADPDSHLRVRLHGEPALLMHACADALAPLVDSGIVHRLQFDTYEREVERYGGAAAIAFAEAIFHADSAAAAAILELGPDPDEQWRTALASVHALLSELIGDAATQYAIARQLRNSFANELAVDSTARRNIGTRYRNSSPALTSADVRVQRIFRERAENLREPLISLKALCERGQLTVSWERFAISCVHMCVNRLLSTEQRTHELVLYDFLERLYLRDRNMPLTHAQ